MILSGFNQGSLVLGSHDRVNSVNPDHKTELLESLTVDSLRLDGQQAEGDLLTILTNRDLRFLGPEYVSTRRATIPQVTLDVFSFGVLCYELITGVPIEPIESSGVDVLADIQ